MHRAAWNRAKKILCVRLDTIGDVLMTTPAVRAIKESAPGRRILFLTSPAGAGAARLVPEIDEVLVYEAPWMKATPDRADSGADFDMIDRLREEAPDGAVIFTVYSQNALPAALLCYLAGIKLRLGYCRENPYQLLTDWLPEREPHQMMRHEVRRQLDLVETIGCRTVNEGMSLRISSRAVRSIMRRLRKLNIIPGAPFVVIHPGATAPSRRYPGEGFAEVARSVTEATGMAVVFTGTEPERPLVESIQRQMEAPSCSLVGCLDLEELAGLLSFASLLIVNNTGPAHMAAAIGTPVISLYALTNPQHTPWRVPSRVLSRDVECKYCYKSVCPLGHNDCLKTISPREIVSAVSELMGEIQAQRSAGQS